MDSKQFDELVARLSSGATRRNAVKGVLGGALASVGVTSVAAKPGTGKGPKGGKGPKEGKGGKGKGKKHGHNKVAICHKGRTKMVPQPAVKGHLKHGDFLVTYENPCPPVA
jgi:hypothetical protein